MKCDVCGQSYGVAHNCAGVPAARMTQEEAAPPPSGFAPLYYLRMAFHIVYWDDVSIRRASRDTNSLYYGGFFWIIAALIILLFASLPRLLGTLHVSGPVLIFAVFIDLSTGLVVMAFTTFVQLGLCHLIAKWFLGATGTFMGVMRPLSLGWFVNVLVLVPVVGLWASGIAWTAVCMLVFEEVDGIGRLQAFAISAGINACFIVLQLTVFAPRA